MFYQPGGGGGGLGGAIGGGRGGGRGCGGGRSSGLLQDSTVMACDKDKSNNSRGHGNPDSWMKISLVHLPISKGIVTGVGRRTFACLCCLYSF